MIVLYRHYQEFTGIITIFNQEGNCLIALIHSKLPLHRTSHNMLQAGRSKNGS